MARLKERYRDEVVPALQSEFQYQNPMQVPQLQKIVINTGISSDADKNQIAVMLKILLPKAEPKSPDAADALAIAITHAHHRASVELRLKVAGA